MEEIKFEKIKSNRSEIKEREKKLKNMFIHQGPLDSVISSTVRRYGLKANASGSVYADPEILLMMNDSMETWY